jgi:hypothetical protein
MAFVTGFSSNGLEVRQQPRCMHGGKTEQGRDGNTMECSPTMTSKALTANSYTADGGKRQPLQETAASPSAKCTRGRGTNTRGSLPRVQHSGKSLRGCLSRGRGLPRVPKIVHSRKPPPSVILALGEALTPSVPSTPVFFETSSPSATLGEEFFF